MSRVLVTGMSGTGKSTVVDALRARGIHAIDTDDGWCIDQPDGTLRWDEPRIGALLSDDEARELVLAGCEENMVGFLPRFDTVILLTAPVPVILERIASRSNNDFGKSEDERQRILGDIATVEPLLVKIADVVIDTTMPLDDVVDRVAAAVRSTG